MSNNRRLQVFVSSTYDDLKNERQAGVEAILTAGHIPAGMELFAAGDQSQMEVIKGWIDQSDVFFLILGGRYGSIEPESGLSYTEVEYRYALEGKKPIFACVLDEAVYQQRSNKYGYETIADVSRKEYGEFRELVLSKMSAKWQDSKDIKIETLKALRAFSVRSDLSGWVRSPEAHSGASRILRFGYPDDLSQDIREAKTIRIVGTSLITTIGSYYRHLRAMLDDGGAIEAVFPECYDVLVRLMSFRSLSKPKPEMFDSDLKANAGRLDLWKALSSYKSESVKVTRIPYNPDYGMILFESKGGVKRAWVKLMSFRNQNVCFELSGADDQAWIDFYQDQFDKLKNWRKGFGESEG